MRKIIVGITGLIASGKTETSRVFKKAGFKVIDVDSFAHGLYKKGRPLYAKLVKKYGKGILASGGLINRRELVKIAFAGKRQYLSFNKLVFPYLNEALQFKIQKLKPEIVVLDMAVLFESGFYRKTGTIIFVSAPEKDILVRLKSRGNSMSVKALTYQKFFKVNKKIALSDYILYNNKNKAALKRTAGQFILKIKEEYGYTRP